LDISSENSFESLGQVFDSVAKVLEEIAKEVTKKHLNKNLSNLKQEIWPQL